MANPYAGEVCIVLNGEQRLCKLTLGALAEFETELGEESLIALIERFEAGRYKAADVLGLVVAGLRGGGWCGTKKDLLTFEIEGGVEEAARVAARLLISAFTPVGQ
ncbi:MAG: gene transfer agent family protein [Pseudomonadota bacterium]